MSGSPRVRWCTTTNRGDRRDHATVADAHQRAAELATSIAVRGTADGVDKLTIWYRADDGRGWKTYAVIDLRALAGAA